MQIKKTNEIMMARPVTWWGYPITLMVLLFIITICGEAMANPNQPLTIIDISERLYDGGPSIAVILSDKLNKKNRYDNFLEVYTDDQRVSGSWILGDSRQILYFPNIYPDTTYTVLVRRGLTAENGHNLKSHVEQRLTTKSIKPSFGFASHGSVLPEKLTSGLPIITVNVEAVDIEFLRVKDNKIVEFMQTVVQGASTSRWDLDRLHPYVESVCLSRFETHGGKNKRTITHINVEQMEALEKPGYYIAVMKAPGRFENQMQTSYFFISDIGIHVRLYKNGLDIISSSLKTGKALPDVNIYVYSRKGKLLNTGYTDEQGHLSLTGLLENPFLITARLEKHVSFVTIKGSALDLSGFSIDGPAFRPLTVFVYTPRQLFRPGETVDFSALLRKHDGCMAEKIPLDTAIRRPDGREVSRFTWMPQSLAYYYKSFTIPDDAPTGWWSMEIRMNPDDKTPIQIFQFQVEEFLPERMKLTLATNQEILAPDELFEINISGEYLYGAPASGNRLKISANIRRDSHPVESLKEYWFGDSDDEMKDFRQELADTRLKEDGTYPLSFSPMETRPISPMRVVVTANLFESGGRPVTRILGRTLWPAPRLVGIRPLFDDNRSEGNATAQFEVVKADREGNLAKAPELQATLIKEDREYHWAFDENRGWHWNYSQAHYPVYRQVLTITAGSETTLTVPVKYGRYRLEIFDPDTGLTSSYRFYAGWYREEMTRSPRPDKVNLLLDKPSYKPGDNAILTIHPPHEGDAVVMVESEKPLFFQRLTLPPEGADLQIPIGNQWNRHDIYITVMVLRGAEAKEKITPNRAMGIIHLPINRNDRKLEISVEAPESMAPENTLSVRIKKDHFNPAMDTNVMITLAAVDVGILNITDFKTPDPFGFFFSRRAYTVDCYDLYGNVIENMEGVAATRKFGGDADLSGFRGSKRGQAAIKILARFSGPVPLNNKGEALVKFQIPDFNGKIRLMALAFSENRFGATQQEVLIRAPLVVELATARFLASKDKSLATLDLHNLSGKDQQLSVRITADSPLMVEDGQADLMLKNNAGTTLRFPLKAGNDLGVGTINVLVSGDNLNIDRHWELSVRPAWPGIVRGHREMIKSGETFTISSGLGTGIMENTLDTFFHISPDPPLNTPRLLKNLLQYPYGCLEQITSRAYPYLFMENDIAQRFDISPISAMERRARVENAIVRIAGMQKSNGDFGLWDNSGSESLWLTPYVAHFLLEANQQGFPVPKTLLQKTLERLYEKLQSSGGLSVSLKERSPGLSFADKAYCAYVLSCVNRAPLGTLRNTFDHHREIALTGLPLVHLGLALQLQGDYRRGKIAIQEGIQKKRKQFFYFGDYGSDIRDTAMILHLLIRHQVKDVDIKGLLIRLDQELRGRRYFSTQEQTAVFLAAMSLTGDHQKWSGILTLNNDQQKLSSDGRLTKIFDANQFFSDISFESTTNFPLFCSVEVAGYPKQPPEQETDHAVIDRMYYTLSGQPIENRTFTVGDLLIAHLKINAKEDIFDALVIDLLPAGFELENQNLLHSEKLERLNIDGLNINRELKHQQVRHMEFRDDRFVAAIELFENRAHHLLYLVRVVTPGTYQLPAPYLEDMYRPEIRAIGADTRKITISEP